MNVEYHLDWDDKSFRMWFLAPRQLLLQDDWEQLVWDETLRQAHSQGVIPIGAVMVTAEEAPKQQALLEGHALQPLGVQMVGIVDVVKVKSEVMIGASLA